MPSSLCCFCLFVASSVAVLLELDFVHLFIGVVDDVAQAVAILAEGHADRDTDIFLKEGLLNVGCILVGFLVSTDWEVSDELIAAEPTAVSVIRKSLVDGLGNGLEDQVAFAMTIGIVDVLEVIGIDEEDGAPLLLFDESIIGRDHLFVEEDTVMDASQLVIVIELTQSLGEFGVLKGLIEGFALEDKTGSRIDKVWEDDIVRVLSDDDITDDFLAEVKGTNEGDLVLHASDHTFSDLSDRIGMDLDTVLEIEGDGFTLNRHSLG